MSCQTCTCTDLYQGGISVDPNGFGYAGPVTAADGLDGGEIWPAAHPPRFPAGFQLQMNALACSGPAGLSLQILSFVPHEKTFPPMCAGAVRNMLLQAGLSSAQDRSWATTHGPLLSEI